jgi:YaaC-like Protein
MCIGGGGEVCARAPHPLTGQVSRYGATYEYGIEPYFYSKAVHEMIEDGVVASHTLAGECYILLNPFSFAVSDIDIHFLLMFILGNLVRYAPAKWSRLVMFSESDELFLIEGFVELSLTKYPALVLNELEGQELRFVLSIG